MIIKIQIQGQEDLGKFYTTLGSPDNNPMLERDKWFFDGSGKQMVMLVEDTKQNVKIDTELWEYTLTLKVAEYIGKMSSDGGHGPDWDTFKPVPGAWILKIFNAIGRYPLTAMTENEPSKPDLETTLRVLADVQNLGKNLPLSTDDEPYPEFMHRILDDDHDRTIGYRWLRNILVALANVNENEFQHLLSSPPCNGSASTDRFAEMTQLFFRIKPPVIFSIEETDPLTSPLFKEACQELLHIEPEGFIDIMKWLYAAEKLGPLVPDRLLKIDKHRELGKQYINGLKSWQISLERTIELIQAMTERYLSV